MGTSTHKGGTGSAPVGGSLPLYDRFGNRALLLSAIMMVLCVGLWTAWNTYASYEKAVESEYRLLEVRARQREARIAGALRSIDLMLGSIKSDLKSNSTLDEAGKIHLLDSYLRQLPEIRNVLIVDKVGRVTATNSERLNLVGFDGSNREYFLFHRDNPEVLASHISRPFKSSLGTFVVTQSRVLTDGMGNFDGVLVASLESAFFNDALEFHIPDKGVQALLINRDGDVLNIVPATDLIGRNLKGGDAFSEHLKLGTPTTKHLHKPKYNSTTKLSVMQDLPGLPLIVAISKDLEVVVADWRISLVSHISGFLALTLIASFFFWLAFSRQNSLVSAKLLIDERELELRTIIETEPECVKKLALDGSLLHMNKAGLAMIEADSLDQVLGQRMQNLVLPEYRDAFVDVARRVFNGESGVLEFEIVGLKGTRTWLETHAVPFRNQNGEITALLGITRNITLRKMAEAEREAALERVKTLEGILPICMYCKKIRNKDESWDVLEKYLADNTKAQLSHGVCPECYHKFEKDMG